MTNSRTETQPMTGDPDVSAVAARPRRNAGGGVAPYGMLALLVILIVAFSVLRPESFATSANLTTVLTENSVLTILALAVMIPLIANDFDLSVASVLGFASVLTAGLPSVQGLPVAVAIVLVLLVGAAIGAVHALLIVKVGLSPVVVTLGTSTILGGATIWYTDGAVLFDGIPKGLTDLGTREPGGIPLPVLYMVVVAAGLWFVLTKRPWGRQLYATGSSEPAARLAGVKTGKVRSVALISCSTLAAFAGVVLTARIGSGNPTIADSYFLPAFAAAFLSLAAIRIGFFNPLGVVLSVYMIAVGVNGLATLGAPSWVEPVFNGTALIVAVALAHTVGRLRRLSKS